MNEDLQCPYCHKWQEVCHDDGFGYSEDDRHEMQCGDCDKYFVFMTAISFDYSPSKADCLNGSPHKLRETITFPRNRTKLYCQYCEHYEDLPADHPYLRKQPTPPTIEGEQQ